MKLLIRRALAENIPAPRANDDALEFRDDRRRRVVVVILGGHQRGDELIALLVSANVVHDCLAENAVYSTLQTRTPCPVFRTIYLQSCLMASSLAVCRKCPGEIPRTKMLSPTLILRHG